MKNFVSGLVFLLLFLGACKRRYPAGYPLPAGRSFYMGFTPFPYDISQQAVDETYAGILRDGDFVVAHFDTGVPWNEALNDLPFPANVQNDIDRVRQYVPCDRPVLLTCTPNHTDRETLAHYWNANGTQQPLPAPWNTYDFDHPDVIAAYIKYCKRLIDAIRPDFFAFGIEVNGGLRLHTAHMDHFLVLADTVYRRIKHDYPGLPVMMTFQDQSYNKTKQELFEVTRRLMNYSDYMAVSTYPFWQYNQPQAGSDPEAIPAGWLSEMQQLAPSKPFAISETGYIAQDLVMPSYGVNIHGTAGWQKAYVDKLLRKAGDLNARFVNWFVWRDYDRLLNRLAHYPEWFLVWRDNGMFDEDGLERPAHPRWREWLNVPRNR